MLRLALLLAVTLALGCSETPPDNGPSAAAGISESTATIAPQDTVMATATALAGANPATASPAPPSSSLPPGLVQARVVRVVDGDTVEADIALGSRATIRYIGVDTPETVAPGQPVGCFGKEASAHNKALVEAKTVYLEKDVSETDRFGRLLRYVYLENGDMVNELLVRDGYAQVATFPPDVKYQQRFLAAQQASRTESRGLWSACAGPAPSTGQPTQPAQGNCHPSYPTVCIPPPPPDLDCGDIAQRRFTVLAPDPHRFDADSDGIGCES
ncbi:MAG: nuclease [Dehalococcoidia bacterium]|nr:nuclease [Dehalococcoidia bacterium]